MDLSKLTVDRGTDGRRRRRRRFPFVRAILLAALLGAAWIYREPLGELVAGWRAEGVEVATVERASPLSVAASSGTAASGTIVARRRAALSADAPGRIVELNVTEGSVVREGDVVARLYSEELEAALRGAEAELASGEVAIRSAEARVEAAARRLVEAEAWVGSVAAQRDEAASAVELAKKEFERLKGLVASGAVPAERFDQAEALATQASARLASAEAVVTRAEAALATAEADVAVARADAAEIASRVPALQAARDLAAASLDKTRVRAPFDGIVVLKDAEVGEVVSPNALGGQSRGSVATMVDFDSLEVQVELPETSLGSVEIGRAADVFMDAFPGERLAGTVQRIWPTANRQKATIEVRVAFDEIDERLRPEMGARVVFAPEGAAERAAPEASEGPPALVVPRRAVVERGGRAGVFVVEGDVARFRPVTVGKAVGQRVALVDPPSPADAIVAAGDRVVLDPSADLADGDRVRVEDTP